MMLSLLLAITLACEPAPEMLGAGLEARGSGDLVVATSALTEARSCHPEDRNIQLELAMTLAWQQRFDEAITLFGDRLAVDPADRAARLGLGRVQSWAGRHGVAATQYDTLLATDPDDIEALNGRAFATRIAWKISEARESYERVLSLQPENAEALEGLKELKTMKRFSADVQLGGFMVSDGQRVVGNRASASYRLSLKSRLAGGVSTSSRIGDSRVEKAASLTFVRELPRRTTGNLGYRLRLSEGNFSHLVSTSITRSWESGWSTTAAARTDAADPLSETLTRLDLLRAFGSRGYAMVQYYRLFSNKGVASQAVVVGARINAGKLVFAPSVTASGGGGQGSLDYALGVSFPLKSARVGLQLGGSKSAPRPRLGYSITLR
ncbi:MAG: tetratricopeptide repeat protein [Rhodothermales bacterium]|nr:tetratricopeptide repeat protein [Rhodothermales bacterium]